MADERLIFPVGFDLEGGIIEMQKEWPAIQKRLQKTIDGKPLTIKVTAKTTNQFETFSGKMRTSINDIRKNLALLEKEWNSMDKNQKFDKDGNLTKEAQEIVRKYNEMKVALDSYGQSLSQISNKIKKSANDEIKAQQKKEKAIRNTNSAYKAQSSCISRLIQRLGIYTSIYAAAGMLRDIRDTTAEFELQEVALGAIIQDAHQAQVLFSQIKAAAVESPYQIKELVNYTKQLAAYGFKQNELFDTTMKLADISAGLGADMSRIILAVGQVSAATVLKGTELRQFTELGIPIVELLAEKFTQLRGEVVTTGEVFEMISDKAVSFKMVEEILNDLTSAGGMFYDMQRKQAETLAGQWSNLKDSIAIAYDEIGNTGTVRGVIEGWISTVKSLVENWRIVGSVIGGVVSSFAGVKLAALFIPRLVVDTQMLAKATADLALAEERYNAAQGGTLAKTSAKWAINQAKYMKMAANATTVFSRSWYKLAASMAGGGWIGLAVTAITVLISWLVSAQREANRLDEELNKIGAESALQTAQSVRNFERLANAAANAADGTKEQADALAELHRSYRDVIPVQDMTIDKLREMQGEYKSLTAAIKEKIAMQAKEEQINLITSEYGGKTSKKEKSAREFLIESGLSSAEATAVMDEIRKAVDDGLIDTTADISEQARQIEKVVYDTTGKVVGMMQAIYRQVAGTTQTVLTGFRPTKMLRTIAKLIGYYTDLNGKLKDVEDSYDTITGKMGQYGGAFEKLQSDLNSVVGKGKQFSFEWNESILRQKVALYKSTIEDMLSNEKIDYNIGDNIDFTEIGKALSYATPQLKNAIAEIEKEYNKLVPTDRMSKVIKDKFVEVAESTGASMDALQGYLKNADISVTDWAKSIEEAVSSTEKKLNEMTFTNQQIEAGLGGPLRPYDEQEIDSTTNKLAALKTILEWISSFLTTQKTTPPDNRLRDLNEEVSLLEKVYAKYKEFLKYMSSADAKSKTEEYFADTIGSLRFGAAFDTTKLKDILTKYQDAARSLPESDKTVLELGFKVDDVSWQETLDDMKKRVAELADAVSRSKEAKDFFNNMLEMTGDKQLSADLTMSVYGGVGDDLKENIRKQLENAFEGVDIRSAFDGDKIDWSQLNDLVESIPIESKREEARKLVKEGIEDNSKLIKSYVKLLMEYDDVQQKRVNIANKTAKDIATIEDGLRLEIEGINKNPDIQNKGESITEATDRADKAIAAIRAREKYELSKLSGDYIRFFSAINSMSSDTANTIRTELRREVFEAFSKGAISAEDLRKELKAIDAQFNKLNENSSFFVAYMNDGFDGFISKIRESGDELDALAAKMKGMGSVNDLSSDEQSFINKMLNIFGGEGQKSLSDLAKSFNGDMSSMGEAVAQVGGKMQAMFSNASMAIAIVDLIIKAVHQTISAIQQIIDQINSMRNEDNQIGGWFKYISDFDKYAFSGWENLKSGNPAGTTADVIGSVISVLQNIQADKIKRLNKDIEYQKDLLKELEYRYRKLENASESAFGTEYLDNYQQRLEKLYAMQDAYEAQAQAERDKGKKADEDAIKDYEDSARDAMDSIEEMQTEISERMLGTDLASAARNFADAWIEAYKEFGNTADAIGQKFSEMIDKMVAESVIAGVMRSALEPVFTMIDNMEKNDFYNPNFWQKLGAAVESATEDADAGAANAMKMLEAMGINIREMGQGMTGISKDIATASEESILGLAAGINTQNFYISQIHAAVLRMEMLMQSGAGGGVNIQDLVTIQNQHLAYLPNIAANTANTLAECKSILIEVRRVADGVDKVITPNGTSANYQVHTTLS